MRKSKFTDSQIMEALKRVDAGLAVPELCRELAIALYVLSCYVRETRRHRVHQKLATRHAYVQSSSSLLIPFA